MSYLEPKQPYTGLSEHSSQLFGGIIPTYGNSNLPYVTQHNYALYRKQLLLASHCLGLPGPLIQIEADDDEHRLRRLVRREVASPKSFELENRNLMVCQQDSNQSTVKLWTVDDNSTNKNLLQYELKYEIPPNIQKPTKFLNIGDVQPIKQIKLPAQPVELGRYDKDTPDILFIRDVAGLKLAKCHDDKDIEVTNILNYKVSSYCKIPYMDEIAITDENRNVFFGDIKEQVNMSRIKSDEPIRLICPTDCPAELMLAAKTKIYQSDFRTSTKYIEPIFNLDVDAKTSILNLSQERIDFLTGREIINHFRPVDTTKELYMVTGIQKIHLFDRRMPNQTILSMAHFDMDGGDYAQISDPLYDPTSNLQIYNYLALNHSIRPSISYWPIGFNQTEQICSSMGPLTTVTSPESIINYCKNHFTSSPQLSEFETDEIPKVPHAFYCQIMDDSRAVVFSQQNTGQIWVNDIIVSGCEQDSEEYKAIVDDREVNDGRVRQVKVFLEDHSVVDELTKKMSEDLVMEKEEIMKVDRSEASGQIMAKYDHWLEKYDKNPPELLTLDDVLHSDVEPMTEDLAKLKLIKEAKSEGHLLSNVILKTVKKANDAWEEKYCQNIDRIIDINEKKPKILKSQKIEQKVLDFEANDRGDYTGCGEFDNDEDD
ncbi:unnamed protein product [Bursaphelenchus okinawaensis]|uniref:Uncharacterized protein n=1 Tax=Bursaphelenchus okinawaensis TaxID=465554 RepID=A0A811LSP9_9BILA|nr:unnamed protein product [Bursaphelenchus okinawaensis]CAG9127501.1 unnamed protein product [Bursaphelenchus okinawaensis]